jgi:hypothetical protein
MLTFRHPLPGTTECVTSSSNVRDLIAQCHSYNVRSDIFSKPGRTRQPNTVHHQRHSHSYTSDHATHSLSLPALIGLHLACFLYERYGTNLPAAENPN